MESDADNRPRVLFWHDAGAESGGLLRAEAFLRPERIGEAAAAPAWGVVLGGSIMDAEFTPRSYEGSSRLVLRSALPTFNDLGPSADGVDTDAAARSLARWGPRGRETFDRACERVAALATTAGVRVCLRPHAAHVLSDIPSCLGFLRRWGRGPFELLVDSLDLLTPGMMGRAEDHIARIADGLTGAPGTAAVLLRKSPTNTPPDLLLPVVQRALKTGTPVIVRGGVSRAIAEELGLA